MKPYKVKVTYETVVIAKSEDEARSSAHYHITGSDECPIYIQSEEVKDLSELPKGWRGGEIPWGDNDEKTINQYLDENKFDK